MSPNFSGTEQENLALGTMVRLVRASESLLRATCDAFVVAGLTEGQFEVLEALYHVGPLAQKEICAKILKSKGNLSIVLGNLLRQGMVLREVQPSDKRYKTVRISPAGEKIMRRIFPGHVRNIVQAMSSLTAKEQETLGALCRKLGRSLKPGQ